MNANKQKINDKMVKVQRELVELVRMLDEFEMMDTLYTWRQVHKAQQAITEASKVMWEADDFRPRSE